MADPMLILPLMSYPHCHLTLICIIHFLDKSITIMHIYSRCLLNAVFCKEKKIKHFDLQRLSSKCDVLAVHRATKETRSLSNWRETFHSLQIMYDLIYFKNCYCCVFSSTFLIYTTLMFSPTPNPHAYNDNRVVPILKASADERIRVYANFNSKTVLKPSVRQC